MTVGAWYLGFGEAGAGRSSVSPGSLPFGISLLSPLE